MSTQLGGIARGDVWRVSFDPQVGAEIAKVRPAVVMDIAAAGRLQLHIIVPVTSGNPAFNQIFWMVPIPATKANGLSHDSFADAFQVKSVSINRFVKKLGQLNQSQLNDIAAAVALCIGYSPPTSRI